VRDKFWAITGVAGFLGSHVAEQLLQRGIPVLGIDNFASGKSEFIQEFKANPNFKFCELDIRDLDRLSQIFAETQPIVVIHLAAIHFIPSAIANPAYTTSLNVHGTQCVLSAAKSVGVRKFWFASTGDVYAPSDLPHAEDSKLAPFNIYGLSKLMGEELIKLEAKQQPEVAFTIGRLFNLYGIRETNPHIIPEILAQFQADPDAPLMLGNLFPKRDMVPVEDAAKAIIATIDRASNGVTTLNIATGSTWSMQELIDLIGKIRQQPLKILQDPKKIRPTERIHLQADVCRLRALIGWVPHSNFYEGLTKVFN
jgi:UDP-glucose 4-epimerase